jgi:hypothetical protein
MYVPTKKNQPFDGAFKTHAQYNAASRSIDALRSRVMSAKQSPVTQLDLLEMFVPPDMRQAAVLCVKEFDVDPGSYLEVKWVDKKDRAAVVNFYPNWGVGEGPQFAFPKGMGKSFYGTEEQREKVTRWLDWRMERGRDWGLVQAVFDKLATSMPTLAHVRFYWSAIVVLCEMNPDTAKLADTIRAWKPPKDIPAINPALRAAVQEADGIVARALMLDKDRSGRDEVNVTIDLTYKGEVVPWGGGYLPAM